MRFVDYYNLVNIGILVNLTKDGYEMILTPRSDTGVAFYQNVNQAVNGYGEIFYKHKWK